MSSKRFLVIIEKESEDEGYFAYSPTVAGCLSNGKTIEEARRNMREAIEQHMASLIEHGQQEGTKLEIRNSKLDDR